MGYKPAQSCKSAQENIEWYKGFDLFKLAWVGPKFDSRDPEYERKMAELKRVFQGHNVLAELVDNWKDGLVSEPFTWYLKDSNGQRVEAAEAEIALQRWLDWVNQQALELDPCTTNFEQTDIWSEFVLSLGVTGEACLRLWQPERFADDPDPIHQIHLHAPKTGTVQVERGDDGFVDEMSYAYGQGTQEKHTRNDRGEMVITTSTNEEPLVIDTGGRWLIQRVQGRSLLTPSAKQKQGSICHALTMKLRNQEIGGFKERTLLNAEFPEDEEGNPVAVERGPGIDQYLYGIPTGDPTSPGYAMPQIHESQPVSVQTFIDSIQIDRTLLYLEFKQGHLLSSGDGGLSGESRIQMRQGFELFLRGYKRPVESAIANILNIVLRILGYTELEAVVQLNITTGKLSAEERSQIIEEYQSGLLSKATAIATLGTVKDVDAELSLIEEDINAAMARQAALAEAEDDES
ncbi:hypothetical protein ACQ4M4_12915 [Leptolyngbya sp. AN02str]|uniref:hypothetical protein n=1 Tax=Leptolyngbya sp. AN02str TaxID=3423363 RepID=UPI003D30F80D